MERILMMMAAANGFMAVAMGAFGAHGLKKQLAALPDLAQRLEWWETAARYQMYHALALGLLAVLATRVTWGGTTAAGWAFQLGILFFSGSLYVMTVTGWRMLGAVTPLGGLGLLAGWVLLFLAAARQQ